jgi:hypothetical protein
MRELAERFRNEFDAELQDGPAWQPIQPAAPTVIKPTTLKPKTTGDFKLAVCLPDPQIGYRRYEDGTLDPFHDTVAIECAMSVMLYVQGKYGISKVVWLGDYLDLPSQSRWAQEPAFAGTTQLAIDEGHRILAAAVAVAPDAEHVLVEGNHDKRLGTYVMNNAMAAYGIKRAKTPPDSWPVMSVPYLLRLDELGVTYIDAWPAGEYWINQRLRAIHGNKVSSGGSTASAYVNASPNISTINGHVHRIEMQYKTTHDYHGPIRSVSASPGCLCRIDGAVPSVNGAQHTDGTSAVHWENWQQGMMLVWYKDEPDDQRFYIEPLHIMDGAVVYEGREFSAKD